MVFVIVIFCVDVSEIVLVCKFDYGFLGFEVSFSVFCFFIVDDSKVNFWFFWMVENGGEWWRDV